MARSRIRRREPKDAPPPEPVGEELDDRVSPQQREILAEFEEHAEPPLAERATTTRERAYVPKRFQITGLPTKTMGADVEVPITVAFAAQFMLDALDEVANGHALVPTLVPDPTPHRAQPRQHVSMSSVDECGADGWRGAERADFERIVGAFRALVDVPPERFWEVVLEKAMRTAIAGRMIFNNVLPETIDVENLVELPIEIPKVVTDTIGTPVVVEDGVIRLPAAPTAADVLAVVRRYSPPGSVPDWVDEKLIEGGLERCTDARGGGRGKNTAKLSVHQWLGHMKTEITKRRRENSKK